MRGSNSIRFLNSHAACTRAKCSRLQVISSGKRESVQLFRLTMARVNKLCFRDGRSAPFERREYTYGGEFVISHVVPRPRYYPILIFRKDGEEGGEEEEKPGKHLAVIAK